MGMDGALLIVDASFPDAWWDEIMLSDVTIDSLGSGVTVRRGKGVVWVFKATGPLILDSKPVIVVQHGGFWRRTREESARLADEIIEKLVALGATRVERSGLKEK